MDSGENKRRGDGMRALALWCEGPGECKLAYTVAMLVARRYVLKGHVQGVGFRFFAEAAARVEGLHGWVANRADGAVEVAVEGDREAVDRFEARIRRGPSRAQVDRVVVDEDVPSGRSSGFEIRRDQV